MGVWTIDEESTYAVVSIMAQYVVRCPQAPSSPSTQADSCAASMDSCPSTMADDGCVVVDSCSSAINVAAMKRWMLKSSTDDNGNGDGTSHRRWDANMGGIFHPAYSPSRRRMHQQSSVEGWSQCTGTSFGEITRRN